MRRTHYLVIIILLIAQTSFGQIYQNMAQPGYKFSRARFDSVLTIPTGLGNLKNISGGQDTGQIRFNVSDSSVYVWNGRRWVKPVGGTDTASLSNRINLKLNIADTASMLSPYAKTAALATKLNISDTATMLANYAKTAAVNLKLNITDTIGNGNLFIRNTTTQENKTFNVKSGRVDSLYASTSAGGRIVSNSGSVAAEWGAGGGRNFDFHGFAGYNLNRASNYTARSFTDKNYVDSIAARKLNISDTATMLAPYSRVTVTSYGKNAGGDSTILVLSNGTRYAAKDSVGGGGASGWSLTGNAGIDTTTNFLGTIDSVGIRLRVAGVRSGIISAAYTNTSFGYSNQLLNSGTTNTSFGYEALRSNTFGSGNNAIGWRSLFSNTTGSANMAMGSSSLSANTTGSNNIAFGTLSLQVNTTGSANTAIGANALSSNTTSSNNTAVGRLTLTANTTGTNNSSFGVSALSSNTTASSNTAVGANALLSNTTSDNNSAFGFQSLRGNTGAGNTGIGFNTYFNKGAGDYNIALGWNAGFSQTSGSYNYLVGAAVQAPNLSGSGQLNIGNVLYGTGMHQSTTNSSTPTAAGAISIGVTAPAASAVLDATSTTKGILIPRMTLTQRNAIASPATGLQVYNTDANTFDFYNGSVWGSVGGGGASAAGSNTEIQYNNSGAFGADASFTYNNTNKTLSIIKTTAGNALDIESQSVRVVKNSAANRYTTINRVDAPAAGDGTNWISSQYNTSNIINFKLNNGGALFIEGITALRSIAMTADNSITTPRFVASSSTGGIHFLHVSDQCFIGQSASSSDLTFRTNASTALNGNQQIKIFATNGTVIGAATTINASAQLQIESTTKGVLFPRMTTVQKLAIGTPAAGLQVYDTTLNQMSYYNGTTWVNF